jgi:glycosyltransferase involved in cell wall biosynthesis
VGKLKKVLFFFPHNPYPPQNGAHKRCLQIISGLKEIGCDIKFLSSEYTTHQPWSRFSLEGLRKDYGCTSVIHDPRLYEKGISVFIDYFKKLVINNNSETQTIYTYFIKSWLRTVTNEYSPDILFMNYAGYDVIIDEKIRKNCFTVMEMHDLVSLNKKMQEALVTEAGFENLLTGKLSDKLLDIHYYNDKNLAADKYEFDIYNKYDITTCISQKERDILAKESPNTKPVYLPMTHSVNKIDNTYDGDVLFCGGPNPFNTQGYYCFVHKILPPVMKDIPDFKLKVTGKFYADRPPTVVDGVTYLGFVEDLVPLYKTARFFICPVFGGTGQQVKIFEAMAHGLPVIAFSNVIIGSPIRHGENGLLAASTEEFSDHIALLWNNKKLCKQLGESARQTIYSDYSHQKLLETLHAEIYN